MNNTREITAHREALKAISLKNIADLQAQGATASAIYISMYQRKIERIERGECDDDRVAHHASTAVVSQG